MSSFRGQWLPGDERGFRDHGHRVHSSGDYRRRPPEHEHAGLRSYARSISKGPVFVNASQAARIGESLLEKLDSMGVACEAMAVMPSHVHGLINVGAADAVALFGRAKQLASRRLSEELPGKLWGASSHAVRIRDRAHFAATRRYILEHWSLWRSGAQGNPSLRGGSGSASG